MLTEVELWEVSLVTFPMLPSARIMGQKAEVEVGELRQLVSDLRRASRDMGGLTLSPSMTRTGQKHD